MGLGLLILVSVGKENIYLSAQPEITFFKIAYKRYTNFSIEPIPQYFKTSPDFGAKCTINLAKNADLLSSMFLYVELPNIQMENFDNTNTNITTFAWVKKIGIALINYVDIEIGGYVIDRHYGDWINIWNEITRKKSIQRSYNKMIGNIPELSNYSQTKKSIILYIPLSFWFCLDTGLALPLIALIHNDIRVNVQFNDINKCYNISPSHYLTVTNNICIYKTGEYFYQNYQNNKIIGEFIYFDPINKYLYYNPIKGTFIVPPNKSSPLYNLIGYISQYVMNINPGTVIIQNNDYFKFNKPSLINSFMLVDYIYLDNFERAKFLNNTHEYLIPIVQTVSDQIIYSMNFGYKLPLINPVKLLVWRGLLVSNYNNNNYFNYTTTPYTDNTEDLIIKNVLVVNSINRMDLDSMEYYTYIPRYQYSLGNENGIYMYSFALNPKEIQPSGSMNFSKIDDAYLQLKLNKIVNYQNPISFKCYAVQYNLLRISYGLGGLVFNE